MALADGSREEGVASGVDVVGHTEDKGLRFLGCVAEEDGDHWVGEGVEVFVVGFDLRFNVAGAGGMDCNCCVCKAGTMGVDDVVQSVFEFFIKGHNHSFGLKVVVVSGVESMGNKTCSRVGKESKAIWTLNSH